MVRNGTVRCFYPAPVGLDDLLGKVLVFVGTAFPGFGLLDDNKVFKSGKKSIEDNVAKLFGFRHGSKFDAFENSSIY